jgi:dihydrofolate reductase
MGKIVNATYMTLDGDTENMQDWHFDYFGLEARRVAAGQLLLSQALIMGRKTYDGFSQAWPELGDADEFSNRMNTIKKYVASTMLTDPSWQNSTVIGSSGDLVAEIRALKDQEGDILQYGYGDVTRLMIRHGLLDELRIWLHPVLSGKASPTQLLYRDNDQVRFTLNGAETHSTGLVVLSYTPVAA